MKKMILSIAIIFLLFYLLHSTPNMALRTQIALLGHPVVAFSTGIIEDDFDGNVDEEMLKEMNAKSYALTEPPTERETQGILRNFIVKKNGFLYFAEYYGET